MDGRTIAQDDVRFEVESGERHKAAYPSAPYFP
jgi:hypothetical protein